MALEIVYRRRALSERIILLTEIALKSRSGALSIEAAMDLSLLRLSEYPESAPVLDASRPDIRLLTIRHTAVLLYTFDDQRLTVLRVLYAGQDIDAVRDSLR